MKVVQINKEPITVNAFKYPKNPIASFPQYEPQQLIDFRSSNIEFAGNEHTGGLRKKGRLDSKQLKVIIEEVHSSDDEGYQLASNVSAMQIESKGISKKEKINPKYKRQSKSARLAKF